MVHLPAEIFFLIFGQDAHFPDYIISIAHLPHVTTVPPCDKLKSPVLEFKFDEVFVS
jgi:hypothetical protein